jgi:hypothetical protein
MRLEKAIYAVPDLQVMLAVQTLDSIEYLREEENEKVFVHILLFA